MASNMAEYRYGFLGTTMHTQSVHLLADKVGQIQSILLEIAGRLLINNT